MLANTAKYLLSIGDIDSRFFDVTGFSGVDSINSPYFFDIEFRMSTAAKTVPPPSSDILGVSCRFDIERNGETIPCCGIVAEFRVCDSDDAIYSIRLAPRMHRLSLNFSSRIFQNLTIPEIIESVVKEADLKEYFRTEKGVDPQMYKPGVSYHYMWVPFKPTTKLGKEFKGKNVKFEIYNSETMELVWEGTAHG